MNNLCILGATGSIGVSTLDVVRRHPDRFRVVALTANSAVERLLAQCEEFHPDYAVMADEKAAEQLREKLKQSCPTVDVLSGKAALEKVAALPEVDAVMAAIVGAAGLLPTLAAAHAGKRILLANKEALVMSGHIMMDAIKTSGAQLLPIDSEHNAIFQCMPSGYVAGQQAQGIRRILLTASGGPFREMTIDELHDVTPEQACAHPNWDMGRKISVDSATMMNKGLELIEACWLFNIRPEQVEVVIHRQSVIHSLVDYVDGSVLAQLGNPDMRTPIANAMAWPERIDSGVESLDLFDIARLDFEEPDMQRFPCLRLAYEAIQKGGTATSVLNAANEIAVEAFLENRLGFTAIPDVIEETMANVKAIEANTLEDVLNADATSREYAKQLVTENKMSVAH